MFSSDSAFASSSETNSASWSLKHDVEVHTEDTGEGVILDTQVNVLLDTESEAAGIREISLFQLSVLDLETSLQDFISFVTSDCNMNCDFFVSLDAETSNGKSGSGRHWLLTGQIFKHFASWIIIIRNLL